MRLPGIVVLGETVRSTAEPASDLQAAIDSY
jgi:hypothetical protein